MVEQIKTKNQIQALQQQQQTTDVVSSQVEPAIFESPIKLSAIHSDPDAGDRALPPSDIKPILDQEDSEDELKLVVEKMDADDAYLGAGEVDCISVTSEFEADQKNPAGEIDPNDSNDNYLEGN